MFIKDGVYREIDVKVDAPIAEGTILTFGGTLAAEDASDAFGIVPENIYVLPPTKKTRVVIGGTIDLDDPANKGVEFSEAVVNALGADINFVPAAEAGGGGGNYDAYDFVISQIDSGTPVLEKGTWQGIYDALQNMEHVTGLYLKNTTPGQYNDTFSMFLPLTYVDYYSSADIIGGFAPYYNGGRKSITINWRSNGTISVSDQNI